MADSTARTLELLSLLQRRRVWSGGDLVARLGVSDRTLRRDVERLRSLGYSVTATRGLDGGYRLDAGPEAVPLLFSDDESVALAIGLHVAATGSIELTEAAVGALAKVLATLPPAHRRRVEAIRSTVLVGPESRASTPALATLATVVDACRDQVRLSFAYQAADDTKSDRYIEPHGVVALWGRWYLVAFDADREDWRTFRLDRISDPRPARNSFPPRKPPAENLHDYVRDRLSNAKSRSQVVVEVQLPGEEVRRRFGRWTQVTDLAPDRCQLTMESDSFDWPTHLLAAIDAPFVVESPAQFGAHLAAVAARFALATKPPGN